MIHNKGMGLLIHMFSDKSSSSGVNAGHVNTTVLLGFRRFIARPGKPNKVISDNASHFKLTAETINKLWTNILQENDVVSYVANEIIQWKFIVELAPWMGG